jgi:hypothetical protein
MKNIPVTVFIMLFCLLNSFAQTTTSSTVTPTPVTNETRNENPSSDATLPAASPAPTETKPFAAKTKTENLSPVYVVKDAPARL